MRQRLTIILTFIVIIGLLVVLNGLSHVNPDDERDQEIKPNRSTYHAGPTGTRALYDFLSESGRQVVRWRERPERLLSQVGNGVSTFVIVGTTRVPVSDDDLVSLLSWTKGGGHLVIIDRAPGPFLLPGKTKWKILASIMDYPGIDVDPGDVVQMTSGVTAQPAVQPSLITDEVRSVMPSKFAARLSVSPALQNDGKTVKDDDEDEELAGISDVETSAPVVLIADSKGALVVDRWYGTGRITLIGDPFVVANAGIAQHDNLQFALNTISRRDGVIAFDEYHQGRGVSRNAFAGYFAGTPVLPIAFQLAALVLLVLWTRSKRFGRPLPLPQVDRRSTLEFVASMAELQERSRAYDLALENIYSRTRRVLARYAGLDYNSSRADISARVALRSAVDAHQLETLMRQCEDAINGEPISWRQSLELVRRLREVETTLGLRMRSRDLRQAAENI